MDAQTSARNARIFNKNGRRVMTRRTGPIPPPRINPQTFVKKPTPSAGCCMPGIKPPPGIAMTLNRAKLRDFMRIGQFLVKQRRVRFE
uniref:Uncharacterized protein n=1 Tax=Acrobeloides nanus TaxID=290746 RepID=A0A914ELG8_9BILA